MMSAIQNPQPRVDGPIWRPHVQMMLWQEAQNKHVGLEMHRSFKAHPLPQSGVGVLVANGEGINAKDPEAVRFTPA